MLSIASCVYVLSLAVYRLYLHPLAKFPGPKLAALSGWYEFYYEFPCKGQFTFHIQELHDKYGEYQLNMFRQVYGLIDRKVQSFASRLMNSTCETVTTGIHCIPAPPDWTNTSRCQAEWP